MENKSRIAQIDYLRGFAIFLVVLGHSIIVFPINLHEVAWCRLVYNTIYSFHMPLFFAISGFCYSIKGTYKDYILTKAKRLIIPFLFFALADILLKVVFPSMVNRTSSINELLFKVFFYGGDYWFLYTLFFVFTIYPAIEILINKYSIPSLLIIIAIGSLSDMLPTIFCIRSVAYYLVPFSLGYYCKSKIRKIESISHRGICLRKHKISISICSILALLLIGWLHGVIDHSAINMLEGLVGITVSVVLSYCITSIFMRFERYSKYSLSLYLFNGYWLVLSRMLIINVLKITNPALVILFIFSICFYCSYILIHCVLSKIPIIRVIIGIR